MPNQSINTNKASISPIPLAKLVLIRGESRKEFVEFVAEITSEIQCSSKVEEEILKKYIFSAWKLRRMQKLERFLLNRQNSFTEEEVLFSDKKRRIRNISRIRLQGEVEEVITQQEILEKQMTKALKQLREEQKSRK